MATERIELELGGKYSASQMFSQAQSDLKAFGREHKDAMDAGKKAVGELAGAFEGKLSGAVKMSSTLISDMARGGMWGIMGSIATSAINMIAQKFAEAKQKAEEFKKLITQDMVEGVKSAFADTAAEFDKVSGSITRAQKESADMLAVLNGDVARSAQMKVHELHIQTLQQMTNQLTASEKGVILAQEAYQKAHIVGAAAIEQAHSAEWAARGKIMDASDRRVAAENALAEALREQQRVNAVMADVSQQHSSLQAELNALLSLNLTQNKDWTARVQNARLALAEFEEQHKAELQVLTETEKAVAVRQQAVDTTLAEEEAATRELTAAQKKSALVSSQNAVANEEAKTALRLATESLEKERKEAEKKAAADARAAEISAVVDKIKCDAIEKDIDYTEWVELATKALEEGYSAETAINLVRLRYKAALEETAKQQEAAAAGQNGKGGAGGTAVQAIAEGVRKGMEGMAVNTNVNTAGVGDGVDQSDEVITLGGLQRDVRDEQRKARNHLDSVKQSSNAMKAYLSGRMSPDVAAAFEKKMQANGWTSRDIQTATEKALKSQLLTHSQAVEQQKAILDIQKKLEKMGLK